MDLSELLKGLEYKKVGAWIDEEVNAIEFDSRKVEEGALFVAIKGVASDGHDFIDKAIEKGAKVIVCEQISLVQEKVLYIVVEDSASALAMMCKCFYDDPSDKIKLVGITGKTTVVTLLYQLFKNLGYQVGLISTVENRIGDEVYPSTHTTPDVKSLNHLLNEMNKRGCEYAFMEVSSHAVVQQRIAGIKFEGAVFTNISHDHLDYHKTFSNYIDAKKAFFDALTKEAFALVNLDDRRGKIMLQNCVAKHYGFALNQKADFKAEIIENSLNGLLMNVDGAECFAKLIGEFNAKNLLTVYAVARLLGADKMELLSVLSALEAPEGRFEKVYGIKSEVIGIVDYAHTPDALEKVLHTVNKIRKNESRLITVVGCGGDRDKLKRPEMAKVACTLSDQVILTSDNPRTESPESILDDMAKGVPTTANKKVLIISDRLQAIKTAVRLSNAGDVIMIAGKGHEKYQEIMGVRLPFDDKRILKEELE